MRNRSFAAAALAALLLAPAAFADWGKVTEKEVVERTVAVDADSLIRIATTNGLIEVTTWDRAEVEIWAEKKAHARDRDQALRLLDETEIVIEESRGRLVIETEQPRNAWRRHGGVSVSYRLKVPRGAGLEARTTNGPITVENLDGSVDVETTNGNIELARIGGDVEAGTTNGGIDARGIDGRLDASTTNGSIDAEIVAGHLDDGIELSTTNGSIELTLPAGLAAEVDARAGNGRVSSELSGGGHGRVSKRSVSQSLNGGGPLIRVRTTNGRIRLREGG